MGWQREILVSLHRYAGFALFLLGVCFTSTPSWGAAGRCQARLTALFDVASDIQVRRLADTKKLYDGNRGELHATTHMEYGLLGMTRLAEMLKRRQDASEKSDLASMATVKGIEGYLAKLTIVMPPAPPGTNDVNGHPEFLNNWIYDVATGGGTVLLGDAPSNLKTDLEAAAYFYQQSFLSPTVANGKIIFPVQDKWSVRSMARSMVQVMELAKTFKVKVVIANLGVAADGSITSPGGITKDSKVRVNEGLGQPRAMTVKVEAGGQPTESYHFVDLMREVTVFQNSETDVPLTDHLLRKTQEWSEDQASKAGVDVSNVATLSRDEMAYLVTQKGISAAVGISGGTADTPSTLAGYFMGNGISTTSGLVKTQFGEEFATSSKMSPEKIGELLPFQLIHDKTSGPTKNPDHTVLNDQPTLLFKDHKDQFPLGIKYETKLLKVSESGPEKMILVARILWGDSGTNQNTWNVRECDPGYLAVIAAAGQIAPAVVKTIQEIINSRTSQVVFRVSEAMNQPFLVSMSVRAAPDKPWIQVADSILWRVLGSYTRSRTEFIARVGAPLAEAIGRRLDDIDLVMEVDFKENRENYLESGLSNVQAVEAHHAARLSVQQLQAFYRDEKRTDFNLDERKFMYRRQLKHSSWISNEGSDPLQWQNQAVHPYNKFAAMAPNDMELRHMSIPGSLLSGQ